jgi:hypothetical protein
MSNETFIWVQSDNILTLHYGKRVLGRVTAKLYGRVIAYTGELLLYANRPNREVCRYECSCFEVKDSVEKAKQVVERYALEWLGELYVKP